MSETESTYFDNMHAETITVGLMDDLLASIRDLAERSGMDEGEAIRYVLGCGLSYLKGDLALRAAEAGDCAPELERISKQMIEYYSQYTVMKFKAFSLMQVARTQELNVSGLRVTEQGLKGVVQRLREENERLATENDELRRHRV